MNIGLYNRDTHVVVPKEPTDAMLSHKSYHAGDWSRRNYEAMLAAAPPHGAAMPTREEIAFTLCRTDEGECFCEKKNCKGNSVCLIYGQQADAILALLAAKLK